MIIMYYELETLEFNKIINKVKEFASLNRSKELLDEIKPINDIDLINSMLDETDEMRNFIIKFGEFPFDLVKMFLIL